MAFKTVTQYNEERYGGMFMLRNDGDSEDVIFLYPDISHVLVADTHYLKGPDFSGYVHCLGRNCPACQKGIRVQTKLMIPMYIVRTGEVLFWDRNTRFETQLQDQVFKHYPRPSDIVFRITRRGAAGSVETTYDIMAVGTNTLKSYDQIMNEKGLKHPDFFDQAIKSMGAAEMNSMLSSNNNSDSGNSYGSYSGNAGGGLPSYQVTPRTSSVPAAAPVPPVPSGGVSVPGPADGWDDDDPDAEPNF